MKEISRFRFGSIEIDGQNYQYDVLIRQDGRVEKRKKKLSKELYGTSHKLSLAEAEYVFEAGAERLIFGTGQFGRCHLSPEAEAFFAEKDVEVILLPTGKALDFWNKNCNDQTIGLFHITC